MHLKEMHLSLLLASKLIATMCCLGSAAEHATAKKCFKYFASPTLVQLSIGLLSLKKLPNINKQ